jgi:hypothetical protein
LERSRPIEDVAQSIPLQSPLPSIDGVAVLSTASPSAGPTL